jgi:hypothetical protein
MANPEDRSMPVSLTSEKQAPVSKAEPRLTLVFGSARSGTSWLAKILETAAHVLYLHEPLRKLPPGTPLPHFAGDVNEPGAGPVDRAAMLLRLAEMHQSFSRPPFFPKTFQRTPTWVLFLAWILSNSRSKQRSIFKWLSRPAAGKPFDLLIKEVDWQSGCETIVQSLHPDNILFIVRHPCGVVCSRLAGVNLGVIPGHDRVAWLMRNRARVEAAGYTEAQVMAMSPWAFYALDWLLQNLGYQEIARTRPGCRTVVFESLCQDPCGEARELFDFLGWQHTRVTDRFIKSSGQGLLRRTMYKWLSKTRWYYDLHRDPEQAAGNWQQLLTKDQVAEIIAITKPFPRMDWWA